MSFHLLQYKHVKIRFESYPAIDRNVSEKFVCLCRESICRMYIIFSTAHAMSNMNNIYQFEVI